MFTTKKLQKYNKNKFCFQKLLVSYFSENILTKQGRKWFPSLINTNDNHFRFMTYNVLAQKYMFPELYQSCNPLYVNWDYRSDLIIQQINDIHPDILTLQEVEINNKILKEISTKFDMNYQYEQKTVPLKIDGCATFWNRSRYDLKDNFVLDLSFEQLHNDIECELTKNLLEYIKYACISQFVILMDKKLNKKILVANVHLSFVKAYNDAKLVQLMIIYSVIHKIMLSNVVDYAFMAGDFNMMPNSMLYNFLTTGDLNINISIQEFGNQMLAKHEKAVDFPMTRRLLKYDRVFSPKIEMELEETKKILNLFLWDVTIEPHGKYMVPCIMPHIPTFALALRNKKLTNFSSAYSQVYQHYYQENNEIFKESFHHALHALEKNINYSQNLEVGTSMICKKMQMPCDYIFYKGDGLKPVKILEVPPLDKLEQLETNLPPNELFPSDHLPLAADFSIKLQTIK